MNPILRNFPDHIDTPRLLVRSPRPGDGEAMFHAIVATLPELRAWPASLPWALFEPSVEASEIFCRQGHADFAARTDLPMLLFLKDSNILVGATGLHRFDWSVPKFEIGYWCSKPFQGQGLMTEAVQALTRFAFDTLSARRIYSLTDAQNHASRRVAERAGYALEGIMRNERVTPDGTMRDTCLYAITR